MYASTLCFTSVCVSISLACMRKTSYLVPKGAPIDTPYFKEFIDPNAGGPVSEILSS